MLRWTTVHRINPLKINTMKTKDYVPGTKSGFRSWVISVHSLVSASALVWGIPPNVVAMFTTMLAQFEVLYQTVDNERLRTTEQVIAFDTYRVEFTAFMRNLVQVHLVRNTAIPYATKIAMNLNVRAANNADRPKIESTPILDLGNGNRGMIKFKLMVTDMGKRAKIHPDADGAELRFYIASPPVPVVPAPPIQGSTAPRIADTSGTTPPAPTPAPAPAPIPVPAPTADTVMGTHVTTRGSFERNLEVHIGKALYVQARWINSTDDSKNGTWSDFKVIVIA